MERRYSSNWALPRRNTVDPQEMTIGENERILAICSYVPVLCLLPYLLDEGSHPFLAFHSRQGFLLFIVEVFAGALYFVPRAGPFLASISLLFLFSLASWSAHKARAGECKAIPFLSPSLEEQGH